MPEQALLEALDIFQNYYGNQKGLIRFGIQKGEGLDYIKTLRQTKTTTYLHQTQHGTELVNMIKIPIYSHGFKAIMIPSSLVETGQPEMIIFNREKTIGTIIPLQQYIDATKINNIKYLDARNVFVKSVDIACFIKDEHTTIKKCKGLDLRRLDDTHFAYIGQQPHQVTILCKNKKQQYNEILHQFTILHLPTTCGLNSNNYVVDTASARLGGAHTLNYTFHQTMIQKWQIALEKLATPM
jgi:hypothetical protein